MGMSKHRKKGTVHNSSHFRGKRGSNTKRKRKSTRKQRKQNRGTHDSKYEPDGGKKVSAPMAMCHKHKEYPTPLLSTLAFNKYEFWCPYCGKHYGFLEPDLAEKTDELQDRHDKYEQAAEEYLRAHVILVATQIKHEGKWIHPGQLPDEILQRSIKVREKGWETGRKAEEL